MSSTRPTSPGNRTTRPSPRTAVRVALAAGTALLAMLAGLFAIPPSHADPEADPAAGPGAPITEGVLTWGVKASWRGYAGEPQLSGGVTQPDPWDADAGAYGGPFEFPVTSGSYDADTGTTHLQADGTIRWQKYHGSTQTPPAGWTGGTDLFVLDVAISDPEVTISADGAFVTAEVVSRNFGTWQLVDYGRIRLVDLQVAGRTPILDAGTTTWKQLTASLTESAAHGAFSDSYDAGQIVDPLTVTYVGAGGVPVVEETWTPEDSTTLTPVLGEVSGEWNSGGAKVVWTDHNRGQAGVAHVLLASFGGGPAQLQAYDLATLAPVGEPLSVPASLSAAFVDSGRGILYYSSTGVSVDSALRWDAASGAYESVPFTPFAIKGRMLGLLWDDAKQRAYSFQRVVPAGAGNTAYDLHEWYLRTYTRTESPDGSTVSFVEDSYRLPSAPTGYNRVWYSIYAGVAALAPDGAIVMPSVANAPTDGVEWGAQRIMLTTDPESTPGSGQGTVTVATIPGTDLAVDGQSRYSAAYSTPDGVVLVRPGTSALAGQVQHLRQTGPGALVTSADPVTLPDGTLSLFVVDPADGTLWSQIQENQHLVGVRAGRVVHDVQQPLLAQRSQGLVVTADHDVYSLSNGTAATGPFTPAPFGLVRFAWQGYSPSVGSSPQSTTVTLDGISDSRAVTLEAAGTATPSPDVVWQRRGPGDLKFADLTPESADVVGGVHGRQLTVLVNSAADGTAYRAVFSNTAGSVATAPATLTVHTPPAVTRQPTAAAVTAGTAATFEVLAVGSPEPTVTWQRRSGGFWQDIEADDENFRITGTSLTVPDTNVDQSGTLFRVRLSNAVATRHSNAAQLTVNAASSPGAAPRTVADGALEWGVKQSFRTYVTGPIAHGDIAVARGVTANPDGTFRFPVSGGTHRPADDVTTVDFTGTVRFTGHDSGAGPALDVTIADPALTVTGDTGVLTADVTSKVMETGETRRYPDVELAAIDASGRASTADQVTLRNAPTTLTTAGEPAFAGFYSAGTALDPLSTTLRLGESAAGSAPVASTVQATLRRTKVAYGASTVADVRVTAAGTTPTGRITVTLAGRRAQGTLVDGSVAVRLPGAPKPGLRPVTVRYAGTTDVAPSSARLKLRVTKARPRVRLSLARRTATGHERLRAVVRVVVPGRTKVRVAGRVLVRDGRRVIARARLERADRGKVSVRLPRLRPGTHRITASMKPSPSLKGARSGAHTIRVRPSSQR